MKYIRTILIISLISLPFMGSDCGDVINSIVVTPDITGSWNLGFSSGNLNDICPGENVQFNANGVATLTCPNRSPINRNYTVSGNTLTYTETNVKYSIQLSSNNQEMTLTGINNNRVLIYQKQVSSDVPSVNPSDELILNSSENFKSSR